MKSQNFLDSFSWPFVKYIFSCKAFEPIWFFFRHELTNTTSGTGEVQNWHRKMKEKAEREKLGCPHQVFHTSPSSPMNWCGVSVCRWETWLICCQILKGKFPATSFVKRDLDLLSARGGTDRNQFWAKSHYSMYRPPQVDGPSPI